MIDTTEIGYAIFYAYGFITEKRFDDWRNKPSENDPSKTNEQYAIDEAEEKVYNGRCEAERIGIADLYDEWIATEKAYFKHCKEASALDDEEKVLQKKRIVLSKKVYLRSLGISEEDAEKYWEEAK